MAETVVDVATAEVDELRAQLREAQETLAAIRAGEVDALLVGSSGAERVYTLAGAERPYRVMVEQMRQGAVTLSGAGDVLYANRRFAELLAVPLERVVATSFGAWVAEESADAWRSLLAPGGGEAELRLAAPGTEGFWAHVAVAHVDDPAADTVCVVVTDLTHQRTHERLRESERRLREMDARKDEFLAMLGHELRNPLAPLTNAAALLRRDEGVRSPRSAWALDVLDRQILHLGRMVDDLLDIARISRGVIELEDGTVDLRDVVNGAVEMARPALDAKRHALAVDVGDEPVPVSGDAARLVQVVSNLLHNSAKYTPTEGHLRVALAVADGGARIVVEDDGAGIDPELLPRVFDLFTQGATTLDRAERGLGLGLHLVKRIVEMHGGEARAASDGPGRGSRFEVVLPLAAATAGAIGASAVARGGAGRRRILVVDDNLDAAESLARLFEGDGHEVRVAADGHRALELAGDLRPEVALLDIGLPGMDGYELARRLREGYGDGLLLVAVTGYGQADDRARAREAGFDHHFVKPGDIAELERVVTGPTGGGAT